MQNITNERPFSILPWVAVWVIYVMFYALSKFYGDAHGFFGGVFLSVDLIFDGIMLFYACWLWKNSSATIKLALGFFALSFLCILSVHVVYNTLYSVLQIPRLQVPVFWLSTYNVLYLAYLFFQIAAWGTIFSTLKAGEKKAIFLYIPVAILMLVTLFIYIFSIQWHSSISRLIGFYDDFDEILELAGFIAAMLCFVIAKNRGISYLALGYSLRLIGNLVMSFGLFSQMYGSSSAIETICTLGTILMAYAMVLIKRNGFYAAVDPWIELPSSNRAKIAYWGFLSSVFAFVIFTIIAYLFGG